MNTCTWLQIVLYAAYMSALTFGIYWVAFHHGRTTSDITSSPRCDRDDDE